MVGIPFEGDDAFIQGRLGPDALFGAELLQGDQAVVVQADRVGIAQKKCAVQILGPGVGRLGQQGAGSVIDLIVICKISVCPGLCRRGRVRRDIGGPRLPSAEKGG